MTDELPAGAMDEILELIYSHQKLAAVKRYKEMRGTSLVEAKHFIEELTEKLQQESPDKFQVQSSAGCAGVLAMIAAFVLSGIASLILMDAG